MCGCVTMRHYPAFKVPEIWHWVQMCHWKSNFITLHLIEWILHHVFVSITMCHYTALAVTLTLVCAVVGSNSAYTPHGMGPDILSFPHPDCQWLRHVACLWVWRFHKDIVRLLLHGLNLSLAVPPKYCDCSICGLWNNHYACAVKHGAHWPYDG